MDDLREVPVFSERLYDVLDSIFKGESPNSGRFCGYCYTPIAPKRKRCRHCATSVEDNPPVKRIPDAVLEMFRQLRRRESLVVNGFAYTGLLSAIVIFIAVFYVMFMNGVGVWWYVANIVFLFVLARVLAGLLGGFIGDELGYRYARRKLVEDWEAYEAEQAAASVTEAEGRS